MSRKKRISPKSQPRTHRPTADGNAFPVVGIGASAGGLEAVTLLLKKLPADTGLALVVVQHMDPTHESALTSILARSTALPVVEARNNMPLAPNRVYVIPPNKLMGVSRRRLKLLPRGDSIPQQAVDHFFRSLAEEETSRAIGVVLSGNGADGTAGLLAIKAAGGITFAQTEKSAKYPAMPASAITAGCVDFVLPPEGIARELARVAGHPYVAPGAAPAEANRSLAGEDKSFAEILMVLRQQMGVDFSQYKHATLRRRIQRRMLLHKFETPKEYAAHLRGHLAEVKDLYNDILIHVTGFFRDPAAYQALKKRIFPRLLRDKAAEEAIRVWVPGCSSGEEVYSIAILLMEHMADRKVYHPLQMFGTDINDAVLEKARAGLYGEGIKADVSEERLRRFFAKTEGGYRINKSIREMCIFARQNVAADPPFSALDLVCCRNVLIYLGAPLQKKVIPLFHYALREGGYLLLGSSETIGGFADLFSLTDKKARIYARNSLRFRPAVAFGRAAPAPGRPAAVAAAPPERPAPAGPGLLDIQRQADRLLLMHFSPDGVVINRHMEVLQFRGKTGPYLEHAHGEASLDLLKMAREGLALDLRNVVAQAIRRGARARLDRARVRQNGGWAELAIEAVPFGVPPSGEKFYLVLFEAASPKAPPMEKTGRKTGKPSPASQTELDRLQDELAATRESLQTIIEEKEATNEELRSANEETMSSNEELQSTNEELQSTNEEVETAKEELQSTNEELTTLNDELESRNTELEQVNNDLHNLLTSVDIPVIILAPDLRIRRFTAVAERTFNLIPSDIGRPITDLNLALDVHGLPKLVREVIDTLATKELEVQSRQGRWWSLRIRPYKTMDNRIDGAVLAVLDIDALKAGARQAAEGRTFAEAVVATARQPMIVLDGDLTIRFANPAFCSWAQIAADAALNQRLFEIGGGEWNIQALRTLLVEKLPQRPIIENAPIEHDFPRLGRRKLRVNARRVSYNQDKNQLVLLAIEDATEKTT